MVQQKALANLCLTWVLYKEKEKELGRKAIASNFDQAFAAARRAGKKEFTWRGKRYNTKMK